MTEATTFADRGIYGVSGSGETRTTCPECSHTRKKKNDKCLSVNVTEGIWYCQHCEWAGSLSNGNGSDSSHANVTYNYCDENGKVLYQKIRAFSKKFWQQTPDGGKLNGVRRVPYRLTELIKSETTVYIVEGEKDADTLAKHGLVATCNDSGAGKWKPNFNEFLKDRNVVIFEDNDDPGKKHGRVVAESLYGIAQNIKIVRFEELKTGGDVTDFLDTHSIDALMARLKKAPLFAGSYSEYFSTPGIVSQIERWNPNNKHTAWPELESEALHGPVGRFVEIVGPETEADSVALLIQFLVTFGNILGRQAHFTAEADRHFTTLNCCLVGETSKGKKGSSLGHVQKLFKGVDDEWFDNCIHSGLSSGEGLIWCIRDEIKKTEPVKKNGIVQDYQEIIIDPGIPDKRALIIESEFASLLRVQMRDGNTISPVIRNAWDGKDLKTLTKNSPAQASSPHISIVGHITKDELLRYLDNTECGNGFANRFLWLCVKRSKVLPEGGNPDKLKLENLANNLIQIINFASSVNELCRDEQAKKLWADVYPKLSEGKPGLLGSVTARSEAQVMRLSCLYALLDMSDTIKVEHLRAGLAVWDYCENSAKYIFGEISGNPLTDQIKKILDEETMGMTRTDINNFFKRHKKSTQIENSLNELLGRGLIFKVEEETSGRPITRWISSRHSAN